MNSVGPAQRSPDAAVHDTTTIATFFMSTGQAGYSQSNNLEIQDHNRKSVHDARTAHGTEILKEPSGEHRNNDIIGNDKAVDDGDLNDIDRIADKKDDDDEDGKDIMEIKIKQERDGKGNGSSAIKLEGLLTSNLRQLAQMHHLHFRWHLLLQEDSSRRLKTVQARVR